MRRHLANPSLPPPLPPHLDYLRSLSGQFAGIPGIVALSAGFPPPSLFPLVGVQLQLAGGGSVDISDVSWVLLPWLLWVEAVLLWVDSWLGCNQLGGLHEWWAGWRQPTGWLHCMSGGRGLGGRGANGQQAHHTSI